MVKIIVSISFLLLVSRSLLFAQQEISEKHIQRAEAYYAIRFYAKAIPEYEKYLRHHKQYDEVLLKLAMCYSKIGQYDEAEKKYESYFGQNKGDDAIRIAYADVLKKQQKYKEALEEYLQLSDACEGRELYISYCDSFKVQSKSDAKLDYMAKNLSKINSAHSDIAPVLYKGDLVFSSNREETVIKKKSSNNDSPLYNILLASGKDSLFPDKVSNFSPRINTIHNECCASFTSDFNKIFFTRSIDKPYSNDPGSKNALKMYSASWENNNWGDWQTFIFNDTTRSYGHPAIEGNEELFFFASDMEGGYGGTDIYVCFNIDHKWTNPINLGPFVNSSYNELYPFYDVTGTLYFSSNRPEGMGGYDIYQATENDEGEYEFVHNVGLPFNSAHDDMCMYWSRDKKIGYFSSNRPGGKGEEDIYIVSPTK